MRFGAHISISGKIYQVAERAESIGANTAQIFSRNPRGWQIKDFLSGDVKRLRENLKKLDIQPLIVHMPYLSNLASPKSELYLKSVNALKEDLRRCELLGAPYLVTHIGSFGASTRKEGIERVVEGINDAFSGVKNDVILLLENTAGSGRTLGSRFEEIARIIKDIKARARVGVCFDTCHGFAAGYDLRTERGVSETLKVFDKVIGLRFLKVIHANDSKFPLDSHTDRHWHIGEGYIGKKGFRALLHHPAIKNLPVIIETPLKEAGDDVKNLRLLCRLAQD
jgi:deoxyribonuclease-4